MAAGLEQPKVPGTIPGIEIGSTAAGIRYQDRDDLVLVSIPSTASTAAVFTRNQWRAAPVDIAAAHLASTNPRALVINAGNANAGTGQRGLDDALESCRLVADVLDIQPGEVLPFSTGVIGEYLPMGAVGRGIEAAAEKLDENGWLSAACAIMTTDTVPKVISRTFSISGQEMAVTGMVKGSGMIHPDMATLLSFTAVDADIGRELLGKLLKHSVDQSFNRITVDGDTSTNDCAVLIANGRSGALVLDSEDSPEFAEAAEAISSFMAELAQQAVRDAEGATRFVEIWVRGASSDADCRTVAFTVAHSPLVKTALFAGDPNWGRILAAAGRAPVAGLDMDQAVLEINGVRIVDGGVLHEDYSEAKGQAALEGTDIRIEIELGKNDTSFTVWTSDLSHDYVSINADYRS